MGRSSPAPTQTSSSPRTLTPCSSDPVGPNLLHPRSDDPLGSREPAEARCGQFACQPAAAEPRRVRGLKKSIQRGFFAALLVEGSSLEIIGGHQRWDAARELGIESVPVTFLRDLSPQERTWIRIADNGSFGTWNIPALTEQVATLPPEDLPLLGLDAPTLDLLDPLDTGRSAAEDRPAFETLTFKLPKEAADLVNEIIKDVCTKEKCKSGAALERICVEWSQSDNSLAA